MTIPADVTAALADVSWLWVAERAMGLTALILLSLATFLGAVVSAQWHSWRFPEVMAVSLHRNVALLSLVFVAVHVLTTIFDTYVSVPISNAFIPFIGTYEPLWVGLGAIAFDIFLVVLITSWLRARIAPRLWRWIHDLTYVCWAIATVHAVGGADERQLTLTVALVGAAVVLPTIVLRYLRPSRTPSAATAPETALPEVTP